MQEHIRNTLREAQTLSPPKVRVTFKEEAINGSLFELNPLLQDGEVGFEGAAYEILLESLSISRKWGKDANRIMILCLRSKFDEDRFVTAMEQSIETIEVFRRKP